MRLIRNLCVALVVVPVVVAGVLSANTRCVGRECEGEVNYAGVREYPWNAPQWYKTQMLQEAARDAMGGCQTWNCTLRCQQDFCGPPFDYLPQECSITDYQEAPADGQNLQITATATGYCECGNGDEWPASVRGRVELTPTQKILQFFGLFQKPTAHPKKRGG